MNDKVKRVSVVEDLGSGLLSPPPRVAGTREESGSVSEMHLRPPKERHWPVIEIFGPTVQGEGAMVGAMTHFIRFGGCGYRCSWCDTMYAVDPVQVAKNRTMMTQDEILTRVHGLGPAPWVTFSGGDPCLQQDLEGIIDGIHSLGAQVCVETQGQFWREWLRKVDIVTLSPKPPSSEMETDWEVLDDITWNLSNASVRYCMKVVVYNLIDLKYAAVVAERYPGVALYLTPCTAQVYPSAAHADIKRDAVIEKWLWLVDQVCVRKREPKLLQARIIPQTHVILWPRVDRGR